MSGVGGIGRAQGGFEVDGHEAAPAAAPHAPAGGEVQLKSGALSSLSLRGVARGEEELALGSRGFGVEDLQKALVTLGKLPKNTQIDGTFGRGTANAVAAFQKESGLTPTGKVDAQTLAALDRKLPAAPPPRTSALPAPQPLTKPAKSYLATPDEKKVYDLAKDKLFTGASIFRGVDLAVTDQDATAILDALDKLPPKSYNNVLHALAATPNKDPWAPTLLDKLVARGTSDFANDKLSVRFSKQLDAKLKPLGDTPDNKILSHISPDNANKLKAWSSWFGKLVGQAFRDGRGEGAAAGGR